MAVGAVANLELASGNFGSLGWSLEAGGGLVAYHGTTLTQTRSAFLQLDEQQSANRIAPIASFAVRLAPAVTAGNPVTGQFFVRAFPTDHFVAADAGFEIGIGF